MRSTRVSSKGQIVIPRDVRARHNWTPGTVLAIEDDDEAVVLRPLPVQPKATLKDLIGCTGYHGPRKSLTEMDAAIAMAAKSRK